MVSSEFYMSRAEELALPEVPDWVQAFVQATAV